MCFSATASFVTAGVTGAIGIVCLIRVKQPRELPLAATPIVFAAQQSIEGLLWLTLPSAPEGPMATGLTLLFLLFAEVLWPVYSPVTALLIEPSERRRRAMFICLAVGVSVAAYLLWWLLARPHAALIAGGHIDYAAEYRHPAVVPIAYIAAVCLPLMLSSWRTIVALGTIIFAGCATAYAFYWEAFVSVWCFFAAAASAVILCHFEWARKKRLRIAR